MTLERDYHIVTDDYFCTKCEKLITFGDENFDCFAHTSLCETCYKLYGLWGV